MNYNDVSILQFQRFHSAVLRQIEKVRHDINVNITDIDAMKYINMYEIGMDILNIFEYVSYEESKKYKVRQLNKKIEKYSFLHTEVPSDKWVTSFEFEGKTYEVMQTPDKWNVGQYVSMANLTKDKDKIIDSLHIIIAVMVCPNDGDIIELSRKFQDGLSVSIAYPLGLFFCAVMLKLPKSTLHYLKEQVRLAGLV